jgi:hypothetical protein
MPCSKKPVRVLPMSFKQRLIAGKYPKKSKNGETIFLAGHTIFAGILQYNLSLVDN